MAKYLIATTTALVLVVALVFGVAAYIRQPVLDGEVSAQGVQGETRVLHDEWGIPHITAENEADAYFALGYAMAQDRLFQMEVMRRLARGELAALLGPKLVPVDRIIRVFRLGAKADEYFSDPERLPQEVQVTLGPFVEGINAYIKDGPLPFEFFALQIPARPFKEADCMAIAGIMPITFADGIRQDPLVTLLKQRHPDMDIDALFPGYSKEIPVTIMETLEEAQQYIEAKRNREEAGHDIPAPETEAVEAALEGLIAWLEPLEGISRNFGLAWGSNSWVLAPSRTESGKPILANDPHIGFTNPSVWYEAHIKVGSFELYGYYMPPIPVALIGHNRDYGWGLTMFANDDVDFFIEKFHPEDNGKVMYKGEWTDVEVSRERIEVRWGKDVTMRVRTTPHGPVINDLIEFYQGYEGPPVSLSWVWQHIEYTDIEAFYRMNHAKDYEDFAEGVALITSLGINVSYADRQGNIAWWAAGRIPVRPAHVNYKEMLDGVSGKDELTGYVPFEINPHLKNPPCGYIATANNMSTVKPVGPLEELQGYWQPGDRAGRIEQLIAQRDDWDIESLKAVQLDDRAYAAPDIVEAIMKNLWFVSALRLEEKEALDKLAEWDYRHNAGSVGACIYQHVCDSILRAGLEDEMGEKLFGVYCTVADHWNFFKHFLKNPDSPFWDDIRTEQIESQHEVVLAAFRDAVGVLEDRYGADVESWSWGRAHKLEFKHPFGYLPVLGLIFNIGPFEVPGATQVINNMLYGAGGHNYDVLGGPSTRRLIDFARPGESLGVLPTGNSGNFLSPHYDDQARMFVEGKYRKITLDWEKIEADAKHELKFVPSTGVSSEKAASPATQARENDMAEPNKIDKTNAQWREELTPEQYHVARECGTEAPFTGEYYTTKDKGTYLCACCGNELFRSETKFESGTGWPSFWTPVSDESLVSRPDNSGGRQRTEVLCNKCNAHLGHVFEDGPDPTGLRYCINSVVLDLQRDDNG